jgi:hypothetical protein
MRKNDVRPPHSDRSQTQPVVNAQPDQPALDAQSDQPTPHQLLTSAGIQALQRTCGNQFVQRMLLQRANFGGKLTGRLFNQLKKQNLGALEWEAQDTDLNDQGRLTVPLTLAWIATQLGVPVGDIALDDGTTIDEVGEHTLTIVSKSNPRSTLEFTLRIVVAGGQVDNDEEALGAEQSEIGTEGGEMHKLPSGDKAMVEALIDRFDQTGVSQADALRTHDCVVHIDSRSNRIDRQGPCYGGTHARFAVQIGTKTYAGIQMPAGVTFTLGHVQAAFRESLTSRQYIRIFREEVD